jgi:hypothetical protein
MLEPETVLSILSILGLLIFYNEIKYYYPRIMNCVLYLYVEIKQKFTNPKPPGILIATILDNDTSYAIKFIDMPICTSNTLCYRIKTGTYSECNILQLAIKMNNIELVNHILKSDKCSYELVNNRLYYKNSTSLFIAANVGIEIFNMILDHRYFNEDDLKRRSFNCVMCKSDDREMYDDVNFIASCLTNKSDIFLSFLDNPICTNNLLLEKSYYGCTLIDWLIIPQTIDVAIKFLQHDKCSKDLLILNLKLYETNDYLNYVCQYNPELAKYLLTNKSDISSNVIPYLIAGKQWENYKYILKNKLCDPNIQILLQIRDLQLNKQYDIIKLIIEQVDSSIFSDDGTLRMFICRDEKLFRVFVDSESISNEFFLTEKEILDKTRSQKFLIFKYENINYFNMSIIQYIKKEKLTRQIHILKSSNRFDV